VNTRQQMTPTEATLRGRLRAHSLHARHDGRQITAKARIAFMARFEAEADPEGVLSAAERHRRASHLKKAYFLRLALKSAAKRRQRHKNNP